MTDLAPVPTLAPAVAPAPEPTAIAHVDVYRRLCRPIPADLVRFKEIRGKRTKYITARHVYNRLDEILGPHNWSEVTEMLQEGPRGNTYYAVARCRLSVHVGELVIERTDVGGASNPDPLVAIKGAYSDAIKRAAVKLGIGRELYGDGVPDYDADEIDAVESAPPPPPPRREERPSREHDGRNYDRPSGNGDRLPSTGKALYAYIKGLEDSGHKGLLRRAQDWVTARHGRDVRLVDLRPEHVVQVVAQVQRVLAGGGEEYAAERPTARQREDLQQWLSQLAEEARVEYWQLLTHCLKWAAEQGWYAPPDGKYPPPKDRLEALYQATREHWDALDQEARQYAHDNNGW